MRTFGFPIGPFRLIRGPKATVAQLGRRFRFFSLRCPQPHVLVTASDMIEDAQDAGHMYPVSQKPRANELQRPNSKVYSKIVEYDWQ